MNTKKTIFKNIFKTILLFFIIQLITIDTYATSNLKMSNKDNMGQKEIVKVADITDIITDANSFIANGENVAQGEDVGITHFADSFVDIGQILVSIGVVVLLIVTALMGIQWIIATPDKKAKLKQQSIGLVISAIVIFGAIGIWKITTDLAKKISDSLPEGVVDTTINNNNNNSQNENTGEEIIDSTQDPVEEPSEETILFPDYPSQDPVEDPVENPIEDVFPEFPQFPIQGPVQTPVQDPIQDPIEPPTEESLGDYIE